MPSDPSSSTDPVTHSDPIPISASMHRNRPRSASDSSEDNDNVPPLSPTSESPASVPSIKTPTSSTSRTQLTPLSPSSPILSYFYGSPNKTPFSGGPMVSRVFEDEVSQEPPPTPATPIHGRRMSTSWIPTRFGPQQNTPTTESQQERGAGVLRRLSLSGGPTRPIFTGQGRSTSPPNNNNDGGTAPARKPSPRASGQHRKAATLSAGTVDANKVPRAPSPMGERILKGFFDGF